MKDEVSKLLSTHPSNTLSTGAMRILESLVDGVGTRFELAKRVGLSAHSLTTCDYLPKLRSLGLIHIKSWFRQTRHFIPIYSLGPGKDAPRPTPYTSAEKTRRHYKANREQVLLLQKIAKARRSGRCAFKRVNDPFLSAFHVFDKKQT